MQAFRYGQNADFYGYKKLYVEAPKSISNLYQYIFNIYSHGEPGYKILSCIFRVLGLPSIAFFAFFGTATILLIAWGIKKQSSLPNISLLIFYPTLFLSYVMSGVRQAAATAIFLCFGLKLLKDKKYFKFFLIVLLCACFHKYTLVLVLLIPLQFIKEKALLISVPVAWILGLGYLKADRLREYIGSLFDSTSEFSRFGSVNVSWLGVAERTVCFVLILLMYNYCQKNELQKILFKIYTLSYIISILFMTSDYASQRIAMPMKMVEIILIPILFSDVCIKWLRASLLYCFIGIETVMALKNLQFYEPEYNCLNRPFVSVFGQEYGFNDNDCKDWENSWIALYESYPKGIEYFKFYMNH